MWTVQAITLQSIIENQSVLSRKPGAFHKNHGKNVRLLEEDTVADSISFRDTVVFTSQPIPQGYMFQVKVLAIHSDLFFVDSMVSGEMS